MDPEVDFSKREDFIDNKLTILSVNIRSLRKNWDELQIAIENTKIKWHVIVLTEINIKKYEVGLYKLDNYEEFYVTRESTDRGGGICMFINKSVCASFQRINLDINDGIWATFQFNDVDYSICAIYRQPSTNKNLFISELKKILDEKLETDDNIIVVGDINIDILKKDEKQDKKMVDKYENCMAEKGLETKVDSPTRQDITKNKLSESCIDHIYARLNTQLSKGYTWKKRISDHFFTILTINIIKQKEDIEQNKVQTTCRLNDENIVKELQFIDWRILDQIRDSNIACDKINEVIKEIYTRKQIILKTYDKKVSN